MDLNARIFVAGHGGLVGSAITRELRSRRYTNHVARTRSELNLEDQAAVARFFETERPEYVFVAAAKVGGIHANNMYPAEFIYSNLMVEANVVHSAWKYGAKKLLFLGSSCIYPKLAPQPMREECLLSGQLEPSNESYAVAKIAGVKLCQAYRKQYGFDAINAMPCNLYGPGDNFHPEDSHVMAGMLRRFHEAKLRGDGDVVIWGTGTPRREFLHVNDLADAVVRLMQKYSASEIVNIGTGEDVTIRELAHLVAEAVGFKGTIRNDPSKLDGAPRKLLDISRLRAFGWEPRIRLEDGIRDTYRWFLQNQATARI